MDLRRLTEEQSSLSRKVSLKDGFGRIRRVAGFDVAFSGGEMFCAGVVLDYPSMTLIEKKTSSMKEIFPYIPTFLSYREFPLVLKTYMRLERKPDLLFLDGNGICHPRGLGLASHVGVSLNKPSIGVAKSRLCGDFREPGTGKPEEISFGKRQVGWAYRGRSRPVFISPGHKVSLKSSLHISLRCMRSHRLPEPLRFAHLYAGEAKRKHGDYKDGRPGQGPGKKEKGGRRHGKW